MSDYAIVIGRAVSSESLLMRKQTILGAAIPGTGGDEVVIVLLDIM
jgi:hypothetical protein